MEKCKGMRDWQPAEMERFRFIERIFRETGLKWGYQEIRTPVLEYLHLFTTAGTLTPDMLGRVYSFLDWDGWSGERVVLRPDGTIPAARLFISELKGLPPAKLCYVQNVFSFEATGRETRERWQCGVELMGGKSPYADGELVLLGQEILEKLGLAGVEVRLAHVGLLRCLFAGLGLEEELLDQVLNGEGERLRQIISSRPQLQEPLSLLFEMRGNSPGFLLNLRSVLLPLVPSLAPALADFQGIAELLSQLGCPYTIDMKLSRGFEYYTGIVFHFYHHGVRVGGGGRYDDLIPLLGGAAVPACGFALYLDHLLPFVPAPPPAGPVAVVGAASPADWPQAFALARELRERGVVAAAETQERQAGVRVAVAGDSFVIQQAGRELRFTSAAEVARALQGAGDAEVRST